MTVPSILVSDVRNWMQLGDLSYQGYQIDRIFWNRGDHFVEVAAEVGPIPPWDGRAVALIDVDNNGALDLLVTTREGPPHLLMNQTQPGDRWIGFTLVGTHSNRDGAGARIEVAQRDRRWYRWATAGKSGLMATSDPRIHFGIPDGGRVDVAVRWPSGLLQRLTDVPTGRYYRIVEGETASLD